MVPNNSSYSVYLRWATLLSVFTLMCFSLATAQTQTLPLSTQFDVTGFLQEATVSGSGATAGGTMKVNGHLITVPTNTIVILPANAVTWQELFAQSPAPYTGSATGMAAADTPAPMSTYEAHVVGNRVIGASDQYIAGLIYISQQGLNSGAGYINFMDYKLGELRVGGTINADGSLNASNPGTRVRINDPSGRYGRVMSPDKRFTVDPDNPTIASETGYPMCFPRTDPAVADDPLCPQGNRPQVLAGNPPAPTFQSAFTTNNVSNVSFPAVAGFPDSHFQAPLEVGDYISFAGTLVNDSSTPTAGNWPGTGSTYISAHTITNNTAIYTFPGSDPAYVVTNVFLLGTGGLSVLGVGEAVIRTRFEGMTTDVADPILAPGTPQRIIHLYGIDLSSSGATSDRDWGTIGVDAGAPTGAVKVRWRFRPPCLPFGSVPTKPDKQCVSNVADTFLPATREMRAVIEGLQSQNPANPTALKSSNGIYYGQYHAPILEYIFPENVPGKPIVENNFNTMPFLACGGYASSANTLAGVLSPWPSNSAPAACAGSCQPVTLTASASPATTSGGTPVTLTAISTAGTAPITFQWTQDATDPVQVLPAGGVAGSTATFTAPLVTSSSTLRFTASATNCSGTVSVDVPVNINGAVAPTVSYTPAAPASVTSGQPFGPFTASCTDPANLLPCTFQWTQTNAGAAGVPTILVPNPKNTAAIGPFTVTLPTGSPAATIQLKVVATNSAGVASAPEFTNVTVNPILDQITITTSVYRFGKQRLDLTVTDTVASPSLVLTLAPYLTQNGTTFDPATLGNTLTNTGNGNYTFTIVGAPEPACNAPLPGGVIDAPCSKAPLIVRSNIGGTSGPNALQKTRQ